MPGKAVEIARIGRRTAVGGIVGGVGKFALAAGRAAAITGFRPGNKVGFLANECAAGTSGSRHWPPRRPTSSSPRFATC